MTMTDGYDDDDAMLMTMIIQSNLIVKKSRGSLTILHVNQYKGSILVVIRSSKIRRRKFRETYFCVYIPNESLLKS